MSNQKENANLAPKKPRRPKKGRGAARGVLWIIALLLSASGVLRLTGESGQAIALGVAELASPVREIPGGNTLDPTSQICAQESDITLVLARLQEREDALIVREGAMMDRMQALAVAEVKIEESLNALIVAEAELKATMTIASTAAEDDLIRLTAVYENMKAKDAAALFEAMDPQFSAGFLGRMRPDVAASVMAGLTPQTAYTISVILAGRNANVPSE